MSKVQLLCKREQGVDPCQGSHGPPFIDKKGLPQWQYGHDIYVNSGLDAIQPNPAGLGQGHLMHRELIAILWQKASLLFSHQHG